MQRVQSNGWVLLRSLVSRQGDLVTPALGSGLGSQHSVRTICSITTPANPFLSNGTSACLAQFLHPHTTVHCLGANTQVRSMASILPEDTVYSGPQAPAPKRVTLRSIRSKYAKGEPISVVTAYDYPSAVHVDNAGIDILLVGDSVAMVVHGHDTTLPVTLDDMLVHCKAASRGARRAFMVGDLPFGSYETSPQQAVQSAVRMMKEGLMDAVKLEGGGGAREAAAKAIVSSGVAVMGHVGLMPQSISVLGGFRPHGQSAAEAVRVLREARALQDAGCFAVVLECVPPIVAAAVTRELTIPTIGIGAGPFCSGQVLVYHDLLGMMQHPHHAKVTPKFCKQYAAVGGIIQDALIQYREEVSRKEFPGPKHSPYKIAEREVEEMERMLRDEGFDSAADAIEDHVHGHRLTRDISE